MELGYTEVPCAVVDIDKVREKALNIALNKEPPSLAARILLRQY
jgi:ParB-like chromosome segregation protein Spo0J